MKNKAIIILAVIFAVGCCKKEEEISKETYSEYRDKNPHTVSSIAERVRKTAHVMEDNRIVTINLDDLSFGEAFSIEHRAKGEGHMFWWQGSQYTTDLKNK